MNDFTIRNLDTQHVVVINNVNDSTTVEDFKRTVKNRFGIPIATEVILQKNENARGLTDNSKLKDCSLGANPTICIKKIPDRDVVFTALMGASTKEPKYHELARPILQIINDKNAVIGQKDVIIAQKDATIDQKDGINDQKEATIGQKDVTIGHRDATILQLQTETATIPGLNQQIGQLQQQVAAIPGLLAQVGTIPNLNLQIQQKDDTIQQKDNKINRKVVKIQLRDDIIRQNTDTISHLSQEINEKDAIIFQKDDEIDRLTDDLSESNQNRGAIESLNLEITRCKTTIDQQCNAITQLIRLVAKGAEINNEEIEVLLSTALDQALGLQNDLKKTQARVKELEELRGDVRNPNEKDIMDDRLVQTLPTITSNVSVNTTSTCSTYTVNVPTDPEPPMQKPQVTLTNSPPKERGGPAKELKGESARPDGATNKSKEAPVQVDDVIKKPQSKQPANLMAQIRQGKALRQAQQSQQNTASAAVGNQPQEEPIAVQQPATEDNPNVQVANQPHDELVVPQQPSPEDKLNVRVGDIIVNIDVINQWKKVHEDNNKDKPESDSSSDEEKWSPSLQ